MSEYNRIDGAALDRHITGNYGEDQFRDLVECPQCDTEFDKTEYDFCPECGWEPSQPDPDAEYDRMREAHLFDDKEE